MRLTRTLAVAVAIAATATACNFSPLRNRIKVGEEAIVIFVGEGADGNTDLFVAPVAGGPVVQLTYTPLIESSPRINPRGEAVAFLRVRDAKPTSQNEVVLMNLLNGAERRLAIPASAGRVQRIAWNPLDSNALFVKGVHGEIFRIATPPSPAEAVPVNGQDVVIAETALGLWVGDPPFATIYHCPAGGICAVGKRVDTTVLATTGHDPLRWGTDSVAWFDGDGMVVRSIGPGPARRMSMKRPPAKPRDGSYSGVSNAGR